MVRRLINLFGVHQTQHLSREVLWGLHSRRQVEAIVRMHLLLHHHGEEMSCLHGLLVLILSNIIGVRAVRGSFLLLLRHKEL